MRAVKTASSMVSKRERRRYLLVNHAVHFSVTFLMAVVQHALWVVRPACDSVSLLP